MAHEEPLGYIQFMNLVRTATAVITDSGGVQEESTYLGIPCLTLRENTERPITVSEGSNRLVKPSDLYTQVQEVLGQISAESLERLLEKLVSFGTRNTLSALNDSTGYGINAASEWILEEMRGFSPRLEVSFRFGGIHPLRGCGGSIGAAPCHQKSGKSLSSCAGMAGSRLARKAAIVSSGTPASPAG